MRNLLRCVHARVGSAERGAIALTAALSMVFVIGGAAMGVDVGHRAWRDRRLQTIADSVSLDAVRAVGDRRVPGSEELFAIDLAQRSAERNSYNWTDTVAGHSLLVEVGMAQGATRTFVALPSGSAMGLANAVRITITAAVESHFLPGTTLLTAEAVALADEFGVAPNSTPTASPTPTASSSPPSSLTTTDGLGGFSIGSFGARSSPTFAQTANQALGGLVNGTITLDAAGYQGLADATITVNSLLTTLGFMTGTGSPEQVLSASVSIPTLLQASIQALAADGSPEALTAAAALASIAAVADADLTLVIGDLLDISASTPGQVGKAKLKVLPFIVAAAEIANKNRLITFNLPASVSGLTGSTLSVGFIEKPAMALGPAAVGTDGLWVTRARTAQARFQLTMSLTDGVEISGAVYPVTVPVYLEGNAAAGSLTATDCTNGGVGIHAETDALRAFVGTVGSSAMTDGSTPATVSPATFVDAPGVVTVTGTGEGTINGAVADLIFPWALPPGTAPAKQTVGATAIRMGDLLEASVTATATTALGLPLPGVDAAVLALVKPMLKELDTIMHDAMAVLGLGPETGTTLAGADVDNFFLSCTPTTSGGGGGSGGVGGSGGGGPGGNGNSDRERRRLIG